MNFIEWNATNEEVFCFKNIIPVRRKNKGRERRKRNSCMLQSHSFTGWFYSRVAPKHLFRITHIIKNGVRRRLYSAVYGRENCRIRCRYATLFRSLLLIFAARCDEFYSILAFFSVLHFYLRRHSYWHCCQSYDMWRTVYTHFACCACAMRILFLLALSRTMMTMKGISSTHMCVQADASGVLWTKINKKPFSNYFVIVFYIFRTIHRRLCG